MLFVGTSIIHPSTEGVFLLCNILDLLIYSIYKGVLAVNSEEYIKLMHDRKESLEDNLFYNMLNGMCDVSKDILKGFYFDNDFVGGKEIMVEI